MMRAVRFEQFGEPIAVLDVVEMPIPEPGPGQVRLRVTHRPVNPSDLETVRGRYGSLPGLPATPGMEAFGTVAALGPDVANVVVGQRVVPLGIGGSWREYAIVDAAGLLPMPDAIPDEVAAQLIGNPLTAWIMMTELTELQPGDWLLQTAAGSTLGRIVIQMARLLGIKTINLVRRPEQVAELLALGAAAAICTADKDVVEQVRALTGRGASAAFEAVGGETGALALRSLRPGGTMIVYGMLSHEPVPVNGGEMLFRGTSMRGFWLLHWFRSTPPAQIQAALTKLVALIATGQVEIPVAATYDLANVRAAMAHAERPGRSGKIILTG